ncbi:MAG: hypothetical protein MET45_20915 [Nostoc sp. LLA-1]|nr:hypothetical protein [Cyanocohniella sp. LLY]
MFISINIDVSVTNIYNLLKLVFSDRSPGGVISQNRVAPCPEGFAQLIADAPDWVEWMG